MPTRRTMDATNIYPIGKAFPVLPNEEPEEVRRKWWLRVTDWVGITMSTLNDKSPNNWSLNPATVTLALIVAGLLTGGGYYIGEKNAEYKQLLEKTESAVKKAEAADTKATYAVSGKDEKEGHKPGSNTNTKGGH